MDLVYPPGYPPRRSGPLARFLPPMEEGSTTRVLSQFAGQPRVILDPFGASPRIALECAQAGHAVIVAANNPVTRFVLRHTLQPLSLTTLQSALARLAALPKDDSRVELFLLDLYATECARCAAPVTAEYFVWDRESEGPSSKIYSCERCSHSGEGTATEADWERTNAISKYGLQLALALEEVAPRSDPDREHAEAALAVYPSRALYALVTLVNKMSQLDLEPALRPAVEALLLSAFDEVNALWAYPEGRPRPRQLSLSPRYREANIWYALERAPSTWAMEPTGVEVVEWPGEGLPKGGSVALFPGSVKELTPTLTGVTIDLVLTSLPRPNQAYWTLSALWASWLWGKGAASPIKMALRRRRYDWAWHSAALQAVMSRLAPILPPDIPVLSILPEAEPGFLAAALAGFDQAGFRLTGRALRVADSQAFLAWRADEAPQAPLLVRAIETTMAGATVDTLLERGEPAPYALLHAAAWTKLAATRGLSSAWRAADGPPLTSVGEAFDKVLADRSTFQHLSRGAEPESGLYWVTEIEGVGAPLADRVEALVLGELRSKGECTYAELDEHVCRALPGLMTPDQHLVSICLESYAEEDPDQGVWRLRNEDGPETRSEDCKDMRELICQLGARLGYRVEKQEQIVWRDDTSFEHYEFRVIETASISRPDPEVKDIRVIYVVPGGRSVLVAEKLRRNPYLREWHDERTRVVKFRHIRRLAAEPNLAREMFAARLAIDPPQHHDPQLPLL